MLSGLLCLALRNDLKKAGFPPEFPEEDPKESTDASSFVRIASINLSGAMTALLKSKPIKKDIATVKWDMDAADALNEEIRKLSKKNKAKLGRAGCTTDELYTLIQTYFGRRLQEFLTTAMMDSSQGGRGMTEKVTNVTGSAKQTALKYANDAGEWTVERINNKLAEQLRAIACFLFGSVSRLPWSLSEVSLDSVPTRLLSLSKPTKLLATSPNSLGTRTHPCLLCLAVFFPLDPSALSSFSS
jgi:hypothetical protein